MKKSKEYWQTYWDEQKAVWAASTSPDLKGQHYLYLSQWKIKK